LLAFAADAADDDDEIFCEMNKFQDLLGVLFVTASVTGLWLIIRRSCH
jgi:hypothetical protein